MQQNASFSEKVIGQIEELSIFKIPSFEKPRSPSETSVSSDDILESESTQGAPKIKKSLKLSKDKIKLKVKIMTTVAEENDDNNFSLEKSTVV